MNISYRSGNSIYGWFGKTTVEELLFYMAFTLFSIAEVLQTTAFTERFAALNTVCSGMLVLTAVLLAFRLLLLRENGWQWIASFVGFALILVIFFLKHFDTVFWLFLFVFVGRDADFKKLAKITLVVVTLITVVSILACYLGIVQNYVINSSERGLRSAMGFKHPNRLAERIAEICISCWYLYSTKHRWRVIALNVAALFFVNSVADSRGSCIVFAALIFAVFVYPHLKRSPKFAASASLILIVGIAALSFYLMVAYTPSNAFMAEFNRLLSRRLSLMNQSFDYAGITPFGADFTYAPVVATHYLYNTEVRFLVDNSYARLFLNNGVVTTVLFFVLVAAVYLRHIREQRFTLALLGLTIILAFGFVENFMLDIQYNYFMFLASEALFTPLAVNGIASEKACKPANHRRPRRLAS